MKEVQKAIFLSLALFLIGLLQINGQNKNFSRKPTEKKIRAFKEEKLKEFHTGTNKVFETTEVPEIWRNESAVILNQEVILNYFINYSEESVRRRVKILDRAALESFSEFHFVGDATIAIKIQKPDGKIIKIDVANAIEVEKEVPYFYRSYSNKRTYEKIAIENLEIGDIIDYYFMINDNYAKALYRNSGPLIFTLANIYPVVTQSYLITASRNHYITCASYNGAPELTELLDNNEGPPEDFKAYILYDEMRAAETSDRWYYKFRSIPYFKFRSQLIKKGASYYGRSFYSNSAGEIKKKISRKEIEEYTNNLMENNTFPVFSYSIQHRESRLFTGHLKKNDLKEKLTVKQLVAEVFYFLRQLDARDKLGDKSGWVSETSYESFLRNMQFILKKRKIKFENLAVMPRERGTMGELLMNKELVFGFRIKLSGKEYYVFDKNWTTNFGDIPSHLEGSDYLATKSYMGITNGNILNPEDYSDEETVTGKLPISEFSENLETDNIQVLVHDDMKILSLDKTSIFKGQTRKKAYEWILWDTKTKESELERFGLTPKSKKILERLEEGDWDEMIKERNDNLRKSLEGEMSLMIKRPLSFELINDGRYHTDPEVKYKTTFEGEGLISKAGKNYILEAGKMIGGQVAIKDDEKESMIYIWIMLALIFRM